MDQYRAGMENETLKAVLAVSKTDTRAGVDALGKFMAHSIEQFGDLAPEMGEIYYQYGSICLLLGEESSDMFGASIQAATNEEAARRAVAENADADQDEGTAVAGSSSAAVAGPSAAATVGADNATKSADTETNKNETKNETNADIAKEDGEDAMETIGGTSAAAADVAGSEKNQGTNEEQQEEGPTEEAILEALMAEYKAKNDKEPTEEVLQQWTTTLREAAAEEIKKQEEETEKQQLKAKKLAAAKVDSKSKPVGAVPAADAMAAIAAIAAKAAAASAASDEAASAEAVAALVAADAAEEPEPVYAEDVNELFEIAWESLESSRVILSRVVESEQDLHARNEALSLLSRTFLRLGDLGVEQGSFAGAAADYHKSLNIREKIFGPSSRKVADVSFSLAQALLYAAPDAPDAENQVNLRIRALDGLTKAATILVAYRTTMAEKNTVPVDNWSTTETLGDVASLDDEEETEAEAAGSKSKAKRSVLVMADMSQEKAVEAAREVIEAMNKTIGTAVVGLDTEVMVKFADMGEILKDLQVNIEEVIDILLNPPKPETAADDENLLNQMVKGKNDIAGSSAAASSAFSSFGASAFGAPTLPQDTKVATLSVKSNKVSTLAANSKTNVRVQANPPGVLEAAAVAEGSDDRKRASSEVDQARGENTKKVKTVAAAENSVSQA